MKKIFRMHDKLYVGLAGLATDMPTFKQKLEFRIKMYQLREEREIPPKVFANLVSQHALREAIRALLRRACDRRNRSQRQPFLCAMDLIGAPVTAKDFVVGGTASEELYGM
jgi:20S proteasome subunit beta 3